MTSTDDSSRVAPWRPIQYLGSKVRALDLISDAVANLRSDTTDTLTVWDAFTGSSVVAQRLASDGHRVWASDALQSASTIAEAMLGVGRVDAMPSLEEIAREVTALASKPDDPMWLPWVNEEQEALAARDGERLLEMNATLPQRWRPGLASQHMSTMFHDQERAATNWIPFPAGLFSSVYAGTYFGITQALAIDRIRSAIDSCTPLARPELSWHRAAMLSALSHAVSKAVYSPGKHFAQPHRIHAAKDLSFHARRALQDRGINVVTEFEQALTLIDAVAEGISGGHMAEQLTVESVQSHHLLERKVNVVYADPPYTAQQYSRFYHVLESLVSGVPPKLQKIRGQFTRGLYPEGKYLSSFSSKRKAFGALRDLVDVTRNADAHIIISYSLSQGPLSGNARMISMNEIVEIVNTAYGSSAVSVELLEHRYRQFNSGDSSVPGRNDPEVLIVGRINAC